MHAKPKLVMGLWNKIWEKPQARASLILKPIENSDISFFAYQQYVVSW